MADGHAFAIDRIGWGFFRLTGTEMSCDLVPKQVEVNPGFGGSANRATEKGFVEVAGGCQVSYREGEVKGSDTHFGFDWVARS